ncbi:DUF1801 domain-containing protein [Acidaminobacter sp.]|uniref:DUF1801 domain-containing protein n=1 Tax=Acidaminobacter sp. TaxID=1872102 RepID=UPI00256BDD7A|nr:DUF1801 domain-containing protein [Acidaminobacter sp.]MDK9711552.1 DUF1801 domain-containing protein [Acidaminobacter sp.]
MDSEMQIKEAKTPQEYLENLPASRREAVEKLRTVILENLPDGFEEVISYGMLGYVVPHTLYPAGYHVNPKEPLPFINLASQKQHIAFYHMGIYAFPDLLLWFEKEYAARVVSKLDMGKSCIRFKKMDAIPYDLIAELCRKITVEQYISLYEESRKPQRR